MTNAYGVPPEKLGGKPSSKVIEQSVAGAKLIKGFNYSVAGILEQDPALQCGKRVLFLASDDEGAVTKVVVLAERLGFSPIKLDGLRKAVCSCWRAGTVGGN